MVSTPNSSVGAMVRQRRARPLAQPGSWLGPRAWIIAGSLWVAACSSEVPGAAAGPSNGSGTGTSGVGGGASSTGAPGGTTTGTTSPSGTTGATPNPGLEGTSLPYTAPEPVSPALERSEERRVGKECGARRS